MPICRALSVKQTHGKARQSTFVLVLTLGPDQSRPSPQLKHDGESEAEEDESGPRRADTQF